jgi:predicted nucleic acid-binding protein
LAKSRRDQKYLGIDSNVLVAYLVPEHPEHGIVKSLSNKNHAINPTVVHETYHTCIFKLKRDPQQTVKALLQYTNMALCLPIMKYTTELGLELGLEHGLGGRDALILASYLSSLQVNRLMTFDKTLLHIGKVRSGRRTLIISAPE